MARKISLMLLVLVVITAVSYQKSTEKAKSDGILHSPKDVQVRWSEKGLEVSWQPVVDASGYNVFWGKEEGIYEKVIETGANLAVISGLQKGAVYNLAVTARNERGESNYSGEVAVIYEDDPNKVPTYLAKAAESAAKGSRATALAYLDTIIRLDPTNAKAFNLGEALNLNLGRPQAMKKSDKPTDETGRHTRVFHAPGSRGSARD